MVSPSETKQQGRFVTHSISHDEYWEQKATLWIYGHIGSILEHFSCEH